MLLPLVFRPLSCPAHGKSLSKEAWRLHQASCKPPLFSCTRYASAHANVLLSLPFLARMLSSQVAGCNLEAHRPWRSMLMLGVSMMLMTTWAMTTSLCCCLRARFWRMGRSNKKPMASNFRFQFRVTQRMIPVLIVGASVTPQAHLPSKTPQRSFKCAHLSRQVSSLRFAA